MRHWRRFLMGLATVSGWSRRGYFIPYRYADDMPPLGEVPAYAPLKSIFHAAEPTFKTVLNEIEEYAAELTAIGSAPPPAPRWQQDWFSTLDAAAAYTIVRTVKPKRIIEVGSGHSTRFMAQAVSDGNLDTRIMAIDPAPRATLAGLNIDLQRQTLAQTHTDIFGALEAGDILFFDSSHILMPGSDVDILFNRLLPELNTGIVIHIHDIFLPDDYPKVWSWRAYNEQNAIAPLLYGGRAAPLFASHYIAGNMQETIRESVLSQLPRAADAVDSSLWLQWRGSRKATADVTGLGFQNSESDS